MHIQILFGIKAYSITVSLKILWSRESSKALLQCFLCNVVTWGVCEMEAKCNINIEYASIRLRRKFLPVMHMYICIYLSVWQMKQSKYLNITIDLYFKEIMVNLMINSFIFSFYNIQLIKFYTFHFLCRKSF